MSDALHHGASRVGAPLTYRNLSMTVVAEMPEGMLLRHAREPYHLVFMSNSDEESALIEGTLSPHPRPGF